MSKITASSDFTKVPDPDVKRFITLFAEQVLDIVNGKLDFGTNFNCKVVSVTFSSSATDTSVAHSLGHVPVGYFEIRKNASMIVYDGSVAWTASSISLRASATGTVSLVVF